MHSVQFYDGDEALLDTLTRFATSGLDRGQAVFVIATAAHIEALRERLARSGRDPAVAAAEERYVELDAADVLTKVVAGDTPDRDAFLQCIGRPLERAAARFGGVAVFAETVTLLCASGRADAALRLERLWEDLCGRIPLDLLCVYPLGEFVGEGGEHLLSAVHSAHAAAQPGGDYAALAEPERLRLMAALQRALEREVALRRSLQERLARRDQEFTDFLENGASPLHKLGADGTILWANAAALDLLGYAADEYVGRDIAEFHVDADAAHAGLRELLAGADVHNAQAQLRHRNGSIVHVQISASALRIHGEFAYARCFLRDVTAHVRIEQRMREEIGAWEVMRRTGVALNSELDVRKLMQAVIDAAIELTRAQFGSLLYRDEDAAGTPLWLRASAGEPRDLLVDFPLSLSSGILAPTLHGERVVRCADVGCEAGTAGSAPLAPALRSYLAAPLVSRFGQVHGGLFLAHPEPGVFTRRDELIIEGIAAQAAVALDNARLFQANEHARREQQSFNETLERRIYERTEAMHRSERQLDQLLSGIADYAIFLLDDEGRVLTWNTGAERTKGYTAQEIIGRSFAQFYTPEDRAAGRPEKALETARSEGKYEAEGWRVRKDGSRFWANVLLDAIHNREGQVVGFAKVTRDMTERRAIEEQLHQSQRMEAVGRLTGGVAHDFNNLLTIIIGNLDAVCRDPGLKPKVRTAAEHALRGAQRATALTQQLLAFSRRQPLNPKPTDVNHLVAGTAELLKRTFGESITIATDLAGDLGTCEIDAPQLESALINLAMNARDAMPTGGRLCIATQNARLDDPVAAGAARDYVTVSIIDTGIGMSANVREHAFEPFFTTKPPGRGTGLGLSQVYGFVKQSGGFVRLLSEPGRGTTVTICLPRLRSELPEAEEAVVAEAPIGHGTILLVEDNEDVRRYGASMLHELGFTVIEAADGETALDLFERHPEVRVLFSDIGLPGIDGVATAERARLRRPDLKVLFTTGYAHHSSALAENEHDDDTRLLRKPYLRAQLAQAIRELLDGPIVPERRLRALVVEDDALLRNLTARMLEQMQFDVTEAGSAAAALDLVSREAGFDFALVDRQLGDGDGLAVVTALRAADSPTPVLLTSGYADTDAPEGLEVLAEILPKPYGYDALADAIARLGLRNETLRSGRP